MNKSITQEELKKVQEINVRYFTALRESGDISLKITKLERDLEYLKKEKELLFNDYEKVLIDEENLLKEITDKYGKVQINFETGEIIS